MTVTVTIDWLSFTTKGDIKDEVLLRLLDFGGAVPETPRFGYDTAYRMPSGLLIMSHSARSEMGRHWVLSGKVLSGLFAQGDIEPIALLGSVARCDAKVTRLDIAKDAVDEEISTARIWKQIAAGNVTGRAHKFSQVEDVTGGHTIYVGSRQSERFARIYNKAAEMGIEGDWTRFEVELKGDVAKEAARAITGGNATLGQIFDGVLKNMAMISSPDYLRVFGREDAIGLPKIEKETDREAWIASQVTRAVLEHVGQYPHSVAVRTLYRALAQIYEQQEGGNANAN